MSEQRLPRDRVPYSAIVDRPALKLPGGARMAVWTIVNVEDWGIERPMPRTVLPPPMGQPLLPDLPNWAWHEYGMRVGFWRFKALYDRLGMRPTLSINARVCVDYPRVAQACRDAGWEFMGHSYEQGPIHREEDQPGMIKRSLDTIEKFTGKRPVGWLGPGLTQTFETPELLVDAGVKYIGDWVYDDEPTVIRTGKGPLVTLPYSVELNDIPMMIVQHHESDYLLKRTIDQFDRVISVNLRGAYICAREAIKQFLAANKPGVIVNISSVHQEIPKPRFIGYSVSKGGMQNLTRTLALEYAGAKGGSGGGPDRSEPYAALAAARAVERECAGCGIRAAVRRLEAEAGRPTRRDGPVVAGVLRADRRARLGDGGVPGVGDLLVAAEGPAEGGGPQGWKVPAHALVFLVRFAPKNLRKTSTMKRVL